jgi:hypothetical protein
MLGKRYARLIDYLKSGELLAEGANAQGQIVTLPRSIWTREQTHIDIRNGDIVECLENVKENEEFYSNPIFMGLMLRMFHVNALNNDRVRSTAVKAPRQAAARSSTKSRKQRTPTPLDESIRAAINAMWGGKRPSDLMVKQVYKQIIEWQRNNQRAAASNRTLQRYFSKRR